MWGQNCNAISVFGGSIVAKLDATFPSHACAHHCDPRPIAGEADGLDDGELHGDNDIGNACPNAHNHNNDVDHGDHGE